MSILLRLLINAVAIWVTATVLPGIELTSDWVGIAIVVVIFALVNALIRPIVRLLTLPLTVLTLGLFALVVNAAMLMLTAWLAKDYLSLGTGLGDQILNAIIGSIIISIVSTVLSMFLPD